MLFLKIYIDLILEGLLARFHWLPEKLYCYLYLFIPGLALAPGFDSGLLLFAAEDEGRTEEPTQRKREKEREKGRVPKSQEIASAAIALGGLTLLFLMAGWFLSSLGNLIIKYWGGFSELPPLSKAEIVPLMFIFVQETMMLLAPMFITVMVLAVISNLVQVGFLFTLKPLAFDFSRIKLDPASIMKKIFISRQVAMNLIKTILKLIFLAWVSYYIIESDFIGIMKTSHLGVGESLKVLGFLAFKLGIILSFILMMFALPDYIYQRYEFTESIKMTKEEVKQEHKESEGDPLVKQRLRQRAVEFMRRNMLAQVPKADVVITNPTHYAVALRYDRKLENAPRVLAKGEDYLSFLIRNLAEKNNIPRIENRVLARALYETVDENDIVPEEFYGTLVQIFMNIDRVRERFAREAAS